MRREGAQSEGLALHKYIFELAHIRGVDSRGHVAREARLHTSVGPPPLVAAPRRPSRNWQFFFVGVMLASILQTLASWLMQLPIMRRLYQRFVWFKPFQWAAGPFQGADKLLLIRKP